MMSFKVGELFTTVEISRCLNIWRTDRANFHDRVIREIVHPAISRINVRTKQENSESYLAYALEYAMGQYEP